MKLIAFEKEIIVLQKELDEFMHTQWGENAWACVDNMKFDYFGEEEYDFFVTIKIRGGDDPNDNSFDCEIDIPTATNCPVDYLKGFITAMMSVNNKDD